MNEILLGDALEVLKALESGSMHMCVTSPPYWGLRDYGVDGQIGLERTLEEYIEKMVAVFREVKRVLRDDGTLWLNLGDCYAGSEKGSARDPENARKYKQGTSKGMLGAKSTTKIKSRLPKKNLIGLPWKVAFALQNDGWILRQDIIWAKSNPMPESVKDRCTKAHEYIFLFSKSRRYYFNNETIKEPAVGFNNISPAGSKGSLLPNTRRRKGNNKSFRGGGAYTGNRCFENTCSAEKESVGNKPNETRLRNKRDVWTISTTNTVSCPHFATFPERLVEPCILAGCPIGGVVLDPFFGSGTSGVVALKNWRNYVGIELNEEYKTIAERRIRETERRMIENGKSEMGYTAV